MRLGWCSRSLRIVSRRQSIYGDGGVLANNVQPTPAFNAMLSVESGVGSALDVSRTHAAYLACYEEQGASSAELRALVPAPEVPLHSWEEETTGGANEEANHVQLMNIGYFILDRVNILGKGVACLIVRVIQGYIIRIVTYLEQGEDPPDKVSPGNKVGCRKSCHLVQ